MAGVSALPARARAPGILCVTSGAREGLRCAIEEVFPGAAWCIWQ